MVPKGKLRTHIDWVVRARRHGWTYARIGARFGVSQQRVVQVLKDEGRFEEIQNVRVNRLNRAKAKSIEAHRAWINRRAVGSHASSRQFKDQLKTVTDTHQRKLLMAQWRRFNSRRGNAKSKGVPFTLQWNDIQWPTHCPVLGVKLLYSAKNTRHEHAASFDKFYPHLGYVPGNVFVISRRANRLKNDATPSEVRLVSEYCFRVEQSHPSNKPFD